ncbi:MAG: glycosyltransferase family 39 protein [Candidatus Sungbacteria bacterium]|uniref:Glycosyltransferase family 39 protein n=1 Tax=Candidatus Sungiibacteriota bacterium TaxID=2750080 RepID=A0A931SDQ1_9BACT|nr:glycosyltransferase family 39 protein [Candidatus Sungbacteria bacterium]
MIFTEEATVSQRFFKKQWKLYVCLGVILSCALLLRAWGIFSSELQGDAALYAMRALGWFDYLAGAEQTSPIVWYGYIPWWANLSFHDRPPLGFLIQHIFFLIFGDHTWVALLPHALAGVASAMLIYLLLRRCFSDYAALFGASLFAVSSYSVWASRIGYLEGLLIFFITLSTYWFVCFMQTKNSKYLYGLSAALAATLLIKYTAIFLMPALITSFLFFYPRVFKKKCFWVAVVLGLVLLSPVIFYNYKVFSTRGHFDADFTSLFGIKTDDFSILANRKVALNIKENLLLFWGILLRSDSLPLAGLFISSFLYGMYRAVVRIKIDILSLFCLLSIFSANAMFLFYKPDGRYLPIVIPFFSVLGAAIFQKSLESDSLKKYWNWILGGAVVFLLIELGFSINTHLLADPIGKMDITYSSVREQESGFEKLDQFLRKDVLGPLPPFHRTFTTFFEESRTVNISGREVVLFDERLSWFSRVWYVDRYNYYYSDKKTPYIYFSYVLRAMPKGENIFDFLRESGVTGVRIVFAAKSSDSFTELGYSKGLELMEQSLKNSGIDPISEIKNSKGETLFRVYHIGLN